MRGGVCFHLGMEEMDEGMRISCHREEKVPRPSSSPSLRSFSFRLPNSLPITSSSLTSLLTKVFIGLRSINYHPISKSHSGTAAILPHRVKSLHFRKSWHLQRLPPLMVELAATKRGKFAQRIPRRANASIKAAFISTAIDADSFRGWEDLSLTCYFS